MYLLSQFESMDSAYWGMGSAANGIIYFSLCAHLPQKSATSFSFNSVNKKITKLFSLSDTIATENGLMTQGKIHTPIYQGIDGYLYFASHFSYPLGKYIPFIKYEGGHLFSLNPKTNEIFDLGIPMPNEGILSMVLDSKRMILYMLTAPSAYFLVYDIQSKHTHNLGRVFEQGSICRSLVVDDEGNVYGSLEPNKIFKFNKSKFILEYLNVILPDSSRKISEWKGPSRKGVNNIGRKMWRSAIWDDGTKKIYGIHAGTSKLFIFDPISEQIEEGKFMGINSFINQPEKNYPTLSLVQFNRTLFYSPAGGFFDYARSEKIKKYSHLVTYDLLKHKKVDHGEIIDSEGRKVFGIAGATVDKRGMLYLVGAVETRKNERYNKHNLLQGKPFHLALIEIDSLS